MTKLLIITASLLSLLAFWLPGAAHTANVAYAANSDFAAGGYGAYNQADLTNPNIQSVDINMNWSAVEPTAGNINYVPLDNEMAAWAAAGKHVNLILRFANETGGGCASGGYLPNWERPRIPWFCDSDLNAAIPDYFSPVFQADWEAFVDSIAVHVAASPYAASVQYVRAGVGLSAEGFFLTYSQNDFAADKQKLVAWGYTPTSWQSFQESLLTYYKTVFTFAPVIYPVVKQDNNLQVQTAQWAVDNGMGVGQEGLVPNYPTDYAMIDEICAYAKAQGAYIQFQTVSGISDLATVQGDINTAEQLGGKTIEWYENISNVTSYQPAFANYQTYVNSN